MSELRQQLRIRGLPVSGTKTALMERLRPFQECSSSTVPNFSEITTVTFPVTPTSTLSSYQSQSSTSMLSNGFYHFGSTSSTPPISPASSDLSVSGSLPDTFNDGPMSSPQFGLQPSPVHGSAEESLMSSMNGGSIQLELEGIDTEKDKMLVEKQKVINELTWKLQQEQRQVEELRMQLQKRKRSSGIEEKQQPAQHFFGVPIKQENSVSSCPFASKQMALKGQAGSSDKLSNCGVPQVPHIVNSHCLEPTGQSTITSSTFLSPQCSPQHSPLGAAKSPQHISLPPSPNSHYLLPVSPEGRSGSPPGSSCLRTAPVSASLHPHGSHPHRGALFRLLAAGGAACKGREYRGWTVGWKLIALQGPLPGFFWGVLPPQPVALEGPQHSSHAPWSPGTAPAALRKPWHSSPLPQGTPAQLSLPLGEHWQSCPCPGRVLAEHPLLWEALALFPQPWRALAQLSAPGGVLASSLFPGGVLAQLLLP